MNNGQMNNNQVNRGQVANRGLKVRLRAVVAMFTSVAPAMAPMGSLVRANDALPTGGSVASGLDRIK